MDLAAAGFDLVHAFDAEAAAREPGLEVLRGRERRGLLIGNTRALWAPFSAALPGLTERDPLEHYTERAIEAAHPGARIYFGHRRYGGAFVPLQRLAVATGLGALAASGLVVHPIYGPWFALRAVVLVDGEPPPRRLPIAKPCACPSACGETLDAARLAHGPEAWQAWLAVRDACSLGAWRYGDDQIRYHYLHAFPTTPV